MASPFGSKVSPTPTEYDVKPIEYVSCQSLPSRKEGVTHKQDQGQKLDKKNEDMEDMRTFIRQKFKQKECRRFVLDHKKGELRCHCGEIEAEHRGMKSHNKPPMSSSKSQEHLDSLPGIQNNIVPDELQKMVEENRNKPHQKEWNKDEDIDDNEPTCTFGEIKFINVEQIGGTKPAKYIRLRDTDYVDCTLELMKKYWKMWDPKPDIVISVVGGAKNFKLDGRMRDTFNNGLIRAAKTTNAWLITSGFNMGVMKFVGQAVQQGQSFSWDNDRMTHLLRCIGIAPWGYVKDRHNLEGENDGKGKFPAHYRTSNVIKHGRAVPLNPDHTHFIFVDDGFRNRYKGVAKFRAQLEQKITLKKDKGLEIPLVLVLVEGGTDAIDHAHTSLQLGIPVVICSGTGRAADIIAYAYSHTKTVKNKKRVIKEKAELKLKEKICEAYEKSGKPIDAEDILNKVKECCQNAELVTIFHMNKHEDLDHAILSGLLKAHCSNIIKDVSQRLNSLNLALTWNRVDIAQEEIFREDVLWTTGSKDKFKDGHKKELECEPNLPPKSIHKQMIVSNKETENKENVLNDVMTRAIVEDKVEFVRLLIQQGVFMKEYLTKKRLGELYNKISNGSHIQKELIKQMGKDISLEDEEEEERSEEDKLKRPYKQLFLWAILKQSQALAKLCWELGEEPVTSAIAATMIYGYLSQECPSHETDLKEKLTEYKMEFENLATSVLNVCHSKNPDKARDLVERTSPAWGSVTCMQMAASAKDQKFLSSVACQNSIRTQWRTGILSSWLKVLFASLFPPLILCLEIAVAPGKNDKFQKLVKFFTSPISKFSYDAIMYLSFTVLFTYLILVDFKAYVITPIEIVCMVWILTYIVDDVCTLICFPSPTVRGTIRGWYGFFQVFDLLNFILALVSFIIHIISPDSFMAVKAIYCVNCIIFYLRVMKVYIANATLGPKLIMIIRMLEELSLFIMVLLMFLLAYGVASQGLLYTQRKQDWNILKDVFYYPYWQLFGEIFLDETTGTDDACVSLYHNTNTTGGVTPCRTSHWLVPILLAGYLMVGNVLLMSLLIAIFSHVFDTVEKNSTDIWKYQMYFLTMEYKNKTFLVPPFSIIYNILLIFAWIYQRVAGKCTKKSNGKDVKDDDLQLFEKEMMANFLRNQKNMEMTSVEIRVSKLLHRRIDELAKLIDEEMVEDKQDIHEKRDANSAHNGEQKYKPELATGNETDPAMKEERQPRKHKKKERKKKKKKDIDKEKEKREKEEDPVAPDESKLNINEETSFSKKPELRHKNILDVDNTSSTPPQRQMYKGYSTEF